MPTGYKHGDTSEKAMVRGALSFMESQGWPVNKSAIFRHFGFSRAQGYAAITAGTARADEPDWVETRGRPSKISNAVLKFLEWMLWNEVGDYDGKVRGGGGGASEPAIVKGGDASVEPEDEEEMAMVGFAVDMDEAADADWGGGGGEGKTQKGGGGPTWETFIRQANAFGLQARFNARTLRRAMGTLSYRRCLRCEETWVNPRHKNMRRDFAATRLGERPSAAEWKRVRFSGELHFGFGLDGRVRLLPRPGEKYCCPECQQRQQQQQQQQQQQSQQQSQPLAGWDRDVKRVHAWAAIGYNYRSRLVFYDEQIGPGSMGVMTPAAYKSCVLEQQVTQWLEEENAGQHQMGGREEEEGEEDDDDDGGENEEQRQNCSWVWEEDYNLQAAGGNTTDKEAEAWKTHHRVPRHRGCPEAPDLCPLDVVFPPGKQWVVEPIKDWGPATLRFAATQAWAAVDQERVNLWVELMPQRLGRVVETEGAMVPW